MREASDHLEVLAYPQFVELARSGGLVHGGRSIEYGPLAGFFARGAGQDPALREYFASFDAVLSYLYDPDGIFAENLRAAGIRRLVTGPHKPAAAAHAIDQLGTPLGELGLELGERTAYLRAPTAIARADCFALHPGSGSPSKNWPAANWRRLAEEILTFYPQTKLSIIGGEADREALEAFADLRGNGRVEFLVNRPLNDLAASMHGTGFYVGHDTGISHLAASLGIPALLLFGPTDPAVWAPPHPQVRVLCAPEGDLSRLRAPAVFAALGKHPMSGLLASPAGRQQNPRS